ncbi:MAG: hypothetical protein Q8R58_12630 [Sulfuricurvum sp.]|nr:hypothetical protein [Sulfuricurvum sp.]
MRSEKQYSKQQLISSLKFVYELLKYELNANGNSKEYLNDLANKKFYDINDDIREQDNDELYEKERYILEKKIYDYDGLKAIDDYRYNNDRLILFRNFLLLLIFMRSMYLPEIKKSKKSNNAHIAYFQNNADQYDSAIVLFKQLFTKNDNLNEHIDAAFDDFIRENFEDSSENIQIDLNEFFNRAVQSGANDSFRKTNMTKFINAFNKLLTRGNQAIVTLFFEMFGNEFGHMDIPQSMMSFLRYYVYNDASNTPSNPITQNLYVNGVGTNSIVAKFIGDIKGSNNDAFKNEQLALATDDNNSISAQIRIIYNRLITNQSPIVNVENNPLLDNKIDSKYDAIISVIPEKFDLFTEREALEKYPLYPKHQIPLYALYEKTIKCMNHKSLMIVPISFISTNAYSTKLFAEDIALLDNGDDIDRDDSKIKSASYQEFLHHYRMGKIIEQRKIKKIMLLPKGMFYHTDEQCVLIELTKEENSGIQFIDITNIDHLIERNGNFVSINNNPRLKHIYDAYNVPTLFVNTNAQSVNEIAGNAILVSKYVSYNDVIQSSNLLPTYHLKHQHTNEDEQRKDIAEYFDVIKLQKFTIDSSNVKGENVDVGYFSQSEFSQYGITSNDELTNIVKTKIKKDNKRVDRLYRVYNNDILIYVHYKDRKDMTMIQINNDDICIGMHNLIAIRLKEQYQKQDGYAKALFLWLMSNNGQEALKSITKTNSDNRPLISINDLKMLQVCLDTDIKKFGQIKKSISTLKRQTKQLMTLFN